MKLICYITLAASLIFCGACATVPIPIDTAGAVSSINEALDDWHEAASKAEEENYMGLISEDGFYLGTDPAERWSKEEFARFVKQYFPKGIGWTYKPSKRHVRVSEDGNIAWFDEKLLSKGYGDLRGTGVLRQTESGWKLVHYNLTFTLPNNVTKEVIKLVRSNTLEFLISKPLPAGTYFLPTTYSSVCDGCPHPQIAMALGIYEKESDAKKALDSLATVSLSPGYPLIVHTDELAPADGSLHGIAVILGLFESEEQATNWTEAYKNMLPTFETIPLLDGESAANRVFKDGPYVKTRLVRIQEGSPVPAYSATDIGVYENEKHSSKMSIEKMKPECTLQPGDFFAIDDEAFNNYYYSWAMIRCPDGETALVPWQSTLLDTAIILDDSNRTRLKQVIGAECDHPSIESWYYDEMGRYR